jgi:hypothetical protein
MNDMWFLLKKLLEVWIQLNCIENVENKSTIPIVFINNEESPAIDSYLFNVLIKHQLNEIINVIDRLSNHIQFI